MDAKKYLEEGARARLNLNIEKIIGIADKISSAISSGNKLIVFGNGGSAADAQHFVAELTGHFMKERKPLAAIALTTNTSSITAIANDYSYDVVFSRQVEALAKPGDVVVGISTSGNSKNVIEGIKSAKRIGCHTIAFTGRSGGQLKGVADETLNVDSDLTSIIQEMHITVIHMICAMIDEKF
ncbi:probable phosphoheptose isomerase [Thermoplasma acidophilum]|uniref:Probable phosphoheptose isomerase n=1 Tax=Thermoplasma acidophilum (strain ATCC 25905 / DSM 1728 / JCM 9062 / NBRC 15155 / AMRC-C165) TaxID=273075 RepID=GMHA_THEAC|nr:D-sedoheptulose 7-phosphate isomerase [Thermoplasma acidophilum]Q9HJV9.1 RecName: Full=Probable phosphoheptose isomerase; AltName: Full=Sedoheptulose 7-phosphate isomerase [Thermoplasma acidophilum DSM 1728]MCY0851150.1 D-sedoheptulose 7-phosphate isomerase [Thermoplasma acidophilum]CAC11983.1 probable phosphoheptose isomerase [Thermoplasma acidophilum]